MSLVGGGRHGDVIEAQRPERQEQLQTATGMSPGQKQSLAGSSMNTNKYISGTKPIHMQAYINVKQVVNMNTDVLKNPEKNINRMNMILKKL